MKKHINTKSERCVHYRGLSKYGEDVATCEAGRVYEEVMRPLTAEEQANLDERQRSEYPVECPEQFGILRRLPCFSEEVGKIDTCPDRRFPTSKEIAEREAEVKKHLEGYAEARGEIIKQIKAAGNMSKDVVGSIKCPVCGGKLTYTRAGAYNGHCETEGCLSWME